MSETLLHYLIGLGSFMIGIIVTLIFEMIVSREKK